MKHLVVLAITGTALLSGCASGGHCLGDFDYQKAYSLPQVNVADVKMPSSSAALVIPQPVSNLVPYGILVNDPKNPGKLTAQCLDTPPRLPSLAAEPTPAKPAKKS